MIADELIDDLRLLEPPKPFQINPWMLAGALAGVLVLWWFIRFCRARRRAVRRAEQATQAQWDALADLERLFALVDREESRPYGIESSAIIRRYIEQRFALNAPRRSTEEFLAEAEHSPRLETAHQGMLREFLRICDLLKFARTLASRDELNQLHEAAVRFVRETHRAPEPAAATAG